MNRINIEGMSCEGCVKSVKAALEKLPGLKNVVVNLEEGFAEYEGMVPKEMVAKAIEALGFDVK
ncbi:MAG: heavy metal-associated domain-containing protein [Ezakiella sp.]|nr:heavy-metal-associated domain-containing protein [Ezakiella sp.]MDD7761587.1 heavy metal-associated domain-containing protein [Bacillota bacterium]MDY3947352.1 heavy metal-associated domain-containing protein [Ezakiella sp.]